MANSVDRNQTSRSAAIDPGLHCLLMHVCPNVSNMKSFVGSESSLAEQTAREQPTTEQFSVAVRCPTGRHPATHP